MVLRALTIYSAATNPPQRTDITVDTGSGAFTGAGTYNNVYRADLYDSQGNLAAIIPCDSANSSINVVSGFFNKDIEFHLKFLYVLGTPEDTSGFFADMIYKGNSLVFVAGKIDQKQFVPGEGASVTCEQFFAQLAQTGNAPAEISAPLTTPTLGVFPAPWQNFAFGGNLFYRIRSVLLPSAVAPVPVFTFEREIPALDSFGIRLLPPPFSIPIALRENGGDPKTIVLRCVQRPMDDWFSNTAGSPANWYIETIGFQTNAIVQFWRKAVVNRYIGAMRAVAGIDALSLLPSLGSIADADWRLRLPVPASQGPLSLQLLGPLDELPSTASVALTFEAFRRHSGGGLQVTAVLQNFPPSPNPSGGSAPWMGFGLTELALNGDSAIRLGSLDLTIAPPPTPPPPPAPAPPPWMTCNVNFADSGGDYWIPQVSIVSTDKGTPLSSVQPGGQDDPGDPQYAAAAASANASNLPPQDTKNRISPYQRQESLVIPIQPDNSASNLSLSFRETSVIGQNQQLMLTVSASSQDTTPNDVLVIDPNPFSVALARLPNLASAASEETNEVAVWSNSFPEGPSWRISAGAGTFQLLLPPQGVGEAMVTGAAGEPAEGQTVDFRFTPLAQASLLTSSQAQRYSEPGWNLRKTLGYPGERAPGAAVNSMQFEMLYGLICNVTTSDLQMSEIFSRLGGFAGPLTDVRTGGLELALSNTSPYTAEQQTWFNTLNGNWAAAYRQLLSRLGVFELWNQERGFDLLLADGISYDLRFDAAALSGGAIYALKVDPAVSTITPLQQNPHSSSATLIDPRFSALGGYGRQRAGFNNDNVKIESSVSMGYLDSLVVSVIGRIANLWNRAKHVTVYERSVRPSRQFYLEQPRLEGRPILRKTQEYIEILQKTRAYPEAGPSVACGFVEACEFKSVRINVDGSAWESKVGTASIIPLWRRDAAPADVYPRPHVTLQMSTDPATGNDSQMAEILNPEKLYFYTDTTQSDPDTDKWPAVQFVDYCNMPPARSVGPNTTPDYLVEPGFGRFTYSLGSDAAQINVVSERTASAMSSALRNVTFMRSQSGLALPTTNDVQMNALLLHDHVANALDQLRKAATAPLAPGQSILQAVQSKLTNPDIQNTIVKPFQNACGVIKGAADPVTFCQDLGTEAVNAMHTAAAPLSNAWQQLATRLRNDFLQVTNTVQSDKDSLEQALVSQVDAAYSSVQSLMGTLAYDLSTAAGLSTELTGMVTSITADLNDLEARVKAAAPDWQNCAIVARRCRGDVNSVLGDVQYVLDAVNGLFGNRALSSTDLQTLSSGLSSFTAAVSTAFSSLLAGIEAQTVANAIAAVESVMSALAGMKLAQQAANLSNDLNIAAGISNQFAESIRTLRDNLRTAIKSVTTGVAADFDNAIQTVLTEWGPPNFDGLLQQAEAIVSQQVSTACSRLLQNFNKLGTQLGSLLNSDSITNLLPAATTASVTDFLTAFEQIETNYTAQLDAAVRRCLDLVDTSHLQAATTNALNLMRAFGAPPAVPGLGFNLPSGPADAIAYFYQTAVVAGTNLLYQLPQNVAVTAALTSIVTQASDAANGALQQLGVNLPTNALLDRLIPDADALRQLNLSELIPSIAGLNLTNLFPNLSVPDAAGDNITISHRLDPQNLRASLDITLSFPIDDYAEVTVFSIGPVTVTAENCVFQAEVHVAGGVGQSPQHTSSGSITADWHCYIAGTELVSFMNTGLTFDEAGHLSFNIQPSQVKLAAVMQFLTELLSELEPDGGLTLNPLPGGIQSLLDLALPDISAGAFGITNLSLGCVFELDFSPFAIKIGANLGQQSAPFTLTVFILGGAGWFEASVTYAPGSGGFSADISIGIMASAGLSIALGPISGGVFIYFGITAEFHIGGQTNSGLTIGLEIMIQGRVSLLGIVDADITLLLEAEYQSGGGLIGRGEVDVSIKICWCFTLEIHKSVEMTFGSATAAPHIAAAAPAAHLLTDAVAAPAPAFPDPLQAYAISVSNRINFLS